VTRRLLALSLSVSVLLAPAIGWGQAKVPQREMTVSWSGRTPSVSFSGRKFLTAPVIKKLKSGLPQRIVTRVYAYRERGKKPISAAVSSCRVVYDLWEGAYRVERSTQTAANAHTATTIAQVAGLCLDHKLTLGNVGAFESNRGKPIYFAVIVELNPLSPDTLRRIRRWLSRSGSGQLEGDAFFGSFVSIFVTRRMGSAERTMTFRSRTMGVPP